MVMRPSGRLNSSATSTSPPIGTGVVVVVVGGAVVVVVEGATVVDVVVDATEVVEDVAPGVVVVVDDPLSDIA